MTPGPLAAFDLAADADERAVKRAYAKRLKVTRPDDDPAGFQALHQAYQDALAYVRLREAGLDSPTSAATDDDAQVDWAEEEGGSSHSPASLGLAFGPGELAPLSAPEPTAPADGERPAGALPVDGPEEQFIFSPAAFVAAAIDEGRAGDPAAFRRWLQAAMGEWPLTAKPVFARAIAIGLFESDSLLAPAIFDVLADELGLNDVQSGLIDPIYLSQYRARMVQAFAPKAAMPPSSMLGRLRSWLHAWMVPAAALALICFGGLTLITLTVPSDPQDPAPWYRSPGPSDGPIGVRPLSGMDETVVKLIADAAKVPNAQAVTLLDQAVARLSGRADLADERLMALTLYNKGNALRETDRDRAYAAYTDLQNRFKDSRDHDLALMVAASYVNMGHEDYETNRLDTALAPYDAVVALYGDINEGQIGIQVAKAMVGQAETLILLRRYEEARRTLDALDDRLSKTGDPAFADFKDSTGTLRERLPKASG